MLTESQLREISGNLARRPGHEAVRAEVYRLLVDHLGASPRDLDFERTLPEVHGRVDAILGRTVFEFKSDLRKEQDEAERQLASYLPDRERETGASHIGIATDGADFIPYEVRRGNLIRRTAFRVKRGDSHGLPLWLSPFLASRPELTPDPQTIRTELGRESLVYEVAGSRLAEFWETAHRLPEVQLKRRLWADRLQTVYGARVDDDALFFQHTYLTIVAKTMATLVLGAEVPDPHDLLSGKPFRDFGIEGVIESDFFDWVLQVEASDDLIRRIAAQVARFRLSDIRHDVLKVLYESLIDPEQRHFLGEYYTPDWLAEWICAAAISNPLEQRVIDPSCGSGTFLFHAVRRFLAAAARSGMKSRDAVKRCTELVMGIDVHPVAVINARITYLLAIGETLLRDRPPISVPVYLGDSMQWGAGTLIAGSGISISVPDGRETLEFPREVAEHPALMDAVIAEMIRMSEEGANESSFSAWLAQHEAAQKLSDNSRRGLAKTYSALTALHASHRNHIWGYIARNLSRPVWLSTPEQKAQVVVGNPPWLSFRHFSNEQRQRFREGCERRGMWAGGKVATHQDLSAYFFVRCMELYLAAKGTIAMVMPFATMSRQQYRGFIWQLHRLYVVRTFWTRWQRIQERIWPI